ncbi:hypothetical protein [Pseudomonas sp. 25 R 14]|nr:hypothetical protein [Pseudomonas sp. 25 R 14]
MLASVAWPALAPRITAAPVSSLSTSSQLSMKYSFLVCADGRVDPSKNM